MPTSVSMATAMDMDTWILKTNLFSFLFNLYVYKKGVDTYPLDELNFTPYHQSIYNRVL
jgi:hypothetical protein